MSTARNPALDTPRVVPPPPGRAAVRAIYLYSGMALRIAATLALIPLLGRHLGPQGYGLFAVANAVSLLVWQIVEFGIPLVASRRFAQADTAAQRNLAMSLGSFARLALVPLGLAFGAAAVIWSPPLRESTGVAVWACLLGVQCAMNFGWLLTAIGASRMQALLETAPAVATLALCALFVRQETDVALVFIVMNLTAFLANAVAFVYARRHGRHVRVSSAQVGEALRGGFQVFLYRLAFMALGTGSAYLLGLQLSSAEVGHYALADRLLSAAAGILQPIAVVLFPDSVRRFQRDPQQASARYMGVVWRVTALSAGCAALGALIGPPVLEAAMGPKFAPSVPYLLLLVWALPFMAMSQMLVSCILYPLHRDLPLALLYLVAAALLGLGSLTLVPVTGAMGMAWLRLLIEALLALGLYLLVRRSLRAAPAPAAAQELAP